MPEPMTADEMRSAAREHAEEAERRLIRLQSTEPAVAKQVHATAALASATLAQYWLNAALDASQATPPPLGLDLSPEPW